MALNASSHNVAGVKTGPTSEPPPAPSGESKEAILKASERDMMGHSAPGRDGGGAVGDKELNAAFCGEPAEGVGQGKDGGGEGAGK